ncbi:acyltransferase [Dechloromonas sp. ZY10]|uniref:acyltransferase family protein n=1 Tax=Dechloromonas aquae TaxID=2664436 RepID=UPI003529C98A
MKVVQRMPLLDGLKGLAAQIILLHHLASYGPLAQALQEAAPLLSSLLFEYGRMAVQVFLVIAGFLAARGLSPDGQALSRAPWPLLYKRYVRLVVPFMVAVSLAVVCAALADRWLDDDMIPARATVGQWLAHAVLLHGVLGVESLSAGVWYVAIDFQLFALMALLLWSGRRRLLAPLLVLLLGLASLFYFNRQTSLDNWALYFFGSYALGAAAWWAGDRRRMLSWLGVICCVVMAALLLDFRGRIVVSLVLALLLGIARRSGGLERWLDRPWLGWLGVNSYSIFLVHFPVLLLANALFAQFSEAGMVVGVFALFAAWTVSVVAGAVFCRWVEAPEASRRIVDALRWLLQLPLSVLRSGFGLLRRVLPDRG